MIKKCKCGSIETQDIKLENSMHYGKRVCIECGKWIKWISDPSKPSHKELCKEAVNIAKKYDTKDVFILNLIKQFDDRGSLSPKQLECLEDFIDEKKL